MTNDEKNKIALFKFSVISPLVSNPDHYKSNDAFFIEQGGKTWKLPNGKEVTVASGTLERWYYMYMKSGFEALMPKVRNDFGKSRKFDNDIINEIKEYMTKYPRMNAKGIYNALIQDGKIRQTEVSYSTMARLFKKLKYKSEGSFKQMLRYECEFANDVWCADSSFGLYLYKDNKKIKLVIIAFIDDASRKILSCKIHESDKINNLLATYKDAIERYGLPKLLNLDNGANYRSNAFNLVNAKLGVGIHYDQPHTPQSKAKIERFFRTLKDQWMAAIDFHDFKSIDEFQKSLDDYINNYNNTVHSSLNGLTPTARFQKDIDKINFIPQEQINECFLLDINRKSTFDSIVQIDDVQFQLPPKFSNRSVQIQYSTDLKHVYVIDGDEKIEATVVDKISNSKIKRNQYKLSSGGEN